MRRVEREPRIDDVASLVLTHPAPNRLATVPVAVVAAVTAVVHLVFAARDGRWFDEGLRPGRRRGRRPAATP